MHMRGHLRRQGSSEGYTSAWKKAVVTLTEDSKTIEFFEGMFRDRNDPKPPTEYKALVFNAGG